MNNHCFCCGRNFWVGEQKYPIADLNVQGRVVFVDQPCYEKVRSIRRHEGGAMWEAMLALTESLSQRLLGYSK